jgi:hypothetical protein
MVVYRTSMLKTMYFSVDVCALDILNKAVDETIQLTLKDGTNMFGSVNASTTR